MSDRNYVTMISDLPELEDVDPGHVNPRMYDQIMDRPDMNDDKFQKHIRATHRMTPQSGMDTHNLHAYGYTQPPREQMMHAMQPMPQEMYVPPPVVPNHMSWNCLDISKHITDCPICSKFYNNDKTIYIITIILLLVICLFLLKRILNV